MSPSSNAGELFNFDTTSNVQKLLQGQNTLVANLAHADIQNQQLAKQVRDLTTEVLLLKHEQKDHHKESKSTNMQLVREVASLKQDLQDSKEHVATQ